MYQWILINRSLLKEQQDQVQERPSMSSSHVTSFDAINRTSCDACGDSASEKQLFASLVAGWAPTQSHDGARYLVNICKPCFLVVLGDLRWRRRLNTLLDDTTEELSLFGLAAEDGPRSITFGETTPLPSAIG